eukprot:1399124-Amphidinium_carterae.1
MRFNPASIHNSSIFRCWRDVLCSNLVPAERMHEALAHACAKLVRSCQTWAKVSSPAATLVMTEARIGWSIQDVATLSTDEGIRLDLRSISRRYIGELAVSASGRWNERFALWQRGWHEEVHSVPPLWLRPIHEVLEQLKGDRLQQKCLQCVMAGGRWTQERLFRHGMSRSDQCMACQSALGTAEHRVLRCPEWEELRQAYLSPQTREWFADGAGGLPLHLLVNGWAPLLAVAWPAAHDPQVMCRGPDSPFVGKVYTDGSARSPRDGQLRRSGFAIVAVTDWDICKLVYGCVPSRACAKQTVEAAETYAVAQLA